MTLEDDRPDPDVLDDAAPVRPGPGPDRYALLAWVELELAVEQGVRVDAAHALIGDAVTEAFGHQLFEWVSGALAAEGRDPADLAVLLADDALAERVLEQVHTRMAEDDEAPDPPDADHGWYAYAPGDPHGGRVAYRRAVRRRAASARSALLTPRRPRVAGRRDR